MKKFYVIENEKPNFYHQDLIVRDRQGNTHTQMIYRSEPQIPTGTKIKEYRCNDFVALNMATSYKIKGKRYIDIHRFPQSQSAIKSFWQDLSFFDRIVLNAELMQALLQRGIMPTLSKNTNLRLFTTDFQYTR